MGDIMKKIYSVTRDFWVGECNIQLRKGDEVAYDDISNSLYVSNFQHEARNLKAAIKAQWLVPVDGFYPELDGPLGETEYQKMDRKRKERFANQASRKKDIKGLVKDEREVGIISEENDLYSEILNAEPVASVQVKSNKKSFDIVEDDTKEVGVATFDKSETVALKKALNQVAKEKTDSSEFKVFRDHYDAESLQVGTYNDSSNEATLKVWADLHWSKKAEVIKSSNDKTFLTQLSRVETSKKIKSRISDQLSSLN